VCRRNGKHARALQVNIEEKSFDVKFRFERFPTGLAAALFIAGYFLHFSIGSLRTEFSPDDLMNCYVAWLRSPGVLLADNLLFFRPTGVYRPLGAIVYRASFGLFGFNLFPLRLFLLLLLAANVFLIYTVCRRLTGSREIGLIAALIGAYHGNTTYLFYNTGTLFDIFCFFFYFSAFAYYLRIREAGHQPGPAQWIAFAFLFILALDSKEMAVSLPVMIAAYEMLYHPPVSLRPRYLLRWLFLQGGGAWVSGGITLAYITGRVMGTPSISQFGGYEISVSIAEYLKQAGHYLNQLFYAPEWFDGSKTLAFLALSLAGAWLLRSRAALLCWVLFVAGLLPLAFIRPRNLDAALIPITGLLIYAAIILVKARDAVVRFAAKRLLIPWPNTATGFQHVFLFGAVALFLLHVHPHDDFVYQTAGRQYAQIRGLREQLLRLHPGIPSGSRILFTQDPFPEASYNLMFVVHLTYRDRSITVDRGKVMNPKPDTPAMLTYDYAFSYENGNLRQLERQDFAQKPSR
jgi:hypothetical protein